MTQALLRISEPPPSVNRAWRSIGGRTLVSKEMRAWKALAAAELATQPGIAGPCYWSAEILIPGHSTKSDLDNLAKGILDALHAAGKTPDDRYLVDLRLRFCIGHEVQISVRQEYAKRWGEVRRASKALVRKLGTVFGGTEG